MADKGTVKFVRVKRLLHVTKLTLINLITDLEYGKQQTLRRSKSIIRQNVGRTNIVMSIKSVEP